MSVNSQDGYFLEELDINTAKDVLVASRLSASSSNKQLETDIYFEIEYPKSNLVFKYTAEPVDIDEDDHGDQEVSPLAIYTRDQNTGCYVLYNIDHGAIAADTSPIIKKIESTKLGTQEWYELVYDPDTNLLIHTRRRQGATTEHTVGDLNDIAGGNTGDDDFNSIDTFSIVNVTSRGGGRRIRAYAGRSLPNALLAVENKYRQLISGNNKSKPQDNARPSIIVSRRVERDEFVTILKWHTEKYDAPTITNMITVASKVTNTPTAQCTTVETVKYMNSAEYLRQEVCVYDTALYQNAHVRTITTSEKPSTRFVPGPDNNIRVIMKWEWAVNPESKWKVIMLAETQITGEQQKMLETLIHGLKSSTDSWMALARTFNIQAEWHETAAPGINNIDIGISMTRLNSKYNAAIRELGIAYGISHALAVKQLVNSAVGLNRRTYREIFPPLGMLVSEKADGKHAIFYSDKDNGLTFIITGDKYYEYRGDSKVESTDAPALAKCVYEGELIDRPGGSPLLLLFDVIYHDGAPMANNTGLIRIQHLDRATQHVADLGRSGSFYMLATRMTDLDTTGDSGVLTGLEVRAKEWIEMQPPFKDKFEAVYLKKRDYEIDGIIIMDSGATYQRTNIYKWKPVESMTIDFLARKCPEDVVDMPPNRPMNNKTCYWLFNGIRPELFRRLQMRRIAKYEKLFPALSASNMSEPLTYFPIQFSPPDEPLAYLFFGPEGLDGKVIELAREESDIADESTSDGRSWRLLRVRDDRTGDISSGSAYGNSYAIAEKTWHSIHNPLTFEDLYNFTTENSYFRTTKDTWYQDMTNYNSFVKTTLIQQLLYKNQWVIDLAAGRGADLFRYGQAGIENLTVVEQDHDALEELNTRKLEIRHTHKKFGHSHARQGEERLPNITMVSADISNRADVIHKMSIISQRRELIKISPRAVVCNFALHYFVDKLPEFVSLVNSLTEGSENATFICTSFDGASVFDLLTKNNIAPGESFKFIEGDRVKYQIERRFTDTQFKKSGQKIGVLLPFSNGQIYEESLVNFKNLSELFALYGFEMTHGGSFDIEKFPKEFNIKPPMFTRDMTPADIDYIKLHSYGVWQRKGFFRKPRTIRRRK